MNGQWRKSSVVFAAAMLSGVLLIAPGCGNRNQTGGELVEPTEEVEASRAAMQNQLEQNPDMYAPEKGANNRR